jgi:Pentapeptide repeats (8 copies)
MTADELLKAYKSGERDFRGAYLRGAYLRGADLRGVGLRDADLRGADLGGADLGGADLGGADLRDADLRYANLRGADLGGADLRGVGLRDADLRDANLRGADLGGADLRGADLGDQWIIQGPARTDGYFFSLMRLTGDQTPMVRAGCRWLSLPNARTHWSETRGGTPLGGETTLILDYLENVMKLRGLS